MKNIGAQQVRDLRRKRLARRQDGSNPNLLANQRSAQPLQPSYPTSEKVAESVSILHPSSKALLSSQFGVTFVEEEKSTPVVATARVLQQYQVRSDAIVHENSELVQLLLARVQTVENQLKQHNKWFYATPIVNQKLYTAFNIQCDEFITNEERVLLLYPLVTDEGGDVWVTVRRIFDNGTIEDYITRFFEKGSLQFNNFTFSNAFCN